MLRLKFMWAILPAPKGKIIWSLPLSRTSMPLEWLSTKSYLALAWRKYLLKNASKFIPWGRIRKESFRFLKDLRIMEIGLSFHPWDLLLTNALTKMLILDLTLIGLLFFSKPSSIKVKNYDIFLFQLKITE